MDILEKGYERMVDFSTFKNSDLQNIGAFIYLREDKGFRGAFKSVDLFIYDNYFLGKDDENFGKHTYKNFTNFDQFTFFMNTAKPFNQIICNKMCFGSSFDFVERPTAIDFRFYKKLISTFTYGDKVLEEALK